ncbi:hypothetical protein [uncultured Dokdonia sp.]|uniref:hypothetical protein n=1 Tax=uncultured Dokdonia sp. TaxID=575653 RepID=UPI00261C1A34|nr:hypothetical protein [uncultured Dokdonia sp.]
MDSNEFFKLLENTKDELTLTNKKIDVGNNRIIDFFIRNNLQDVQFKECTFINSDLLFKSINGPLLSIEFYDCVFLCDVLFYDGCNLDTLKFINCEIAPDKQIRIINNKIKFFTFSYGKEIELNGIVFISKNRFVHNINIASIQQKHGSFVFLDNTIQREEGDPPLSSYISDSNFNNFNFYGNTFKEDLFFERISLKSPEIQDNFSNCIFSEISFTNVDFGNKTVFKECTFNEEVFFIDCKNINNSKFSLPDSLFKKKAKFNGSEFSTIKLINTIFEGSVSFENVSCNVIEIDQAVFEKAAFFDDFKVLSPENCSRKSLRIIKHQLQKSDNRIDYNRFKIYELDAFKRELHNKEWKDKFILWLNNISSKHGTDWVQGIKFTVIIGFLFYSLYFPLEFYSYDFEFSLESINKFFSGYFKYLIPSYKSPFGESALSNVFQIIAFIFGKAFIGYGIYQTIQSFRKFRL